MTYAELQQTLKSMRSNGIDVQCKLNAKTAVLQAEYDRLMNTPEPRYSQELVDACIAALNNLWDRTEADKEAPAHVKEAQALAADDANWEEVVLPECYGFCSLASRKCIYLQGEPNHIERPTTQREHATSRKQAFLNACNNAPRPAAPEVLEAAKRQKLTQVSTKPVTPRAQRLSSVDAAHKTCEACRQEARNEFGEALKWGRTYVADVLDRGTRWMTALDVAHETRKQRQWARSH